MAYGQSFNWNPSYGNGGVVIKTTDKPGNANYEVAESTLELADKKKLIAAYSSSVYLLRYLSNGMPDSSYGIAGRSTAYNLSLPKLHRLADGKILLIGTRYNGTQQLMAYRLLADGTPDPAFNNGTPVTFSFPGFVPPTIRCATLPDGKLLVMGAIGPDHILGTPPIVYHLLANGEADPAFGNSGIVLSNIPTESLCLGFGVSGARLMTAYLHPQTGNVVVAAYKIDGTPDSTYGSVGNGTLELDIMPIQKHATLTVLPDGRTLVGASVDKGGGAYDFRYEVRCLLPGGDPDQSFGTMGTARVPNSFNMFRGTFLLPDGQGFTSVGITGYYQPYKVTYTRFGLNGALQTAYGNNGQQTFSLTADYLNFNEGRVDADGTITLSGRVAKTPDDFLVVSRVDANGVADQNWAADGFKLGFLASAYTYLYDPVQLPNGSLLTRYFGIGDKRQTGLLRLTPKGTNDSSYGTHGLAATEAEHFDTLSKGRAITGQTVFGTAYSDAKLQLTRLLANGQPDPAFGTNGTKTTVLLNGFYLWMLRSLPNDKVLVHGTYQDANYNQRFFICRLHPDGSLDTGFGVDGYVIFTPEQSFTIRDIKSLPDGRLLLAGEKGGPNNFTRMVVARLTPDGSMDPSFGGNGMVVDSSSLATYSSRLLLQPGGYFLLQHAEAMQAGNNNYFRGAIARFDSLGQRMADFDAHMGTGSVSHNQVVLTDGRFLTISFGYLDNNVNDMRLELRKPDGAIDSDFGNYGNGYITKVVPGSYWYESVIMGNRIHMLGRLGTELDSKALIGLLNVEITEAAIASFTLVDATTDKDIRTLSNGEVFNLADIRGKRINIRANITGAPVKSVVMNLNGTQQRTQTENSAPYALFGNTDNNYWNWTPAAGNYVLKARPYSGSKATGAAGKPLEINFFIKDELTLAGLSLINADNNRVMGPLLHNATVDLAYYPYINVRANPGKGYTESVLFLFNGLYHRVENTAPFAIAADNRGDYYNWSVQPGYHNIVAIPFPDNDGRGQQGTVINQWVRIINSKPTTGGMISATGVAPELNTESGLTAGVYPNPLAGEGTLTYGAATTTQLSVVLYDANGTRVQQLFNGKVDGGVLYRTPLNTRHLRAGTYFCRILSADGRMQTVQVVKQ